MYLFKDVLDIIYDYTYSMEHYDKFKSSLKIINDIVYESNDFMSSRTNANINIIYFISLSHKFSIIDDGLKCKTKLKLKIFKNKKKTTFDY